MPKMYKDSSSKVCTTLEPLRSRFRYFPQSSSLRVISGGDWTYACQEFVFPECGTEFYVPRELTAFVRDSRNGDENVRRASHGFVGHGSFCEFSSVGQQLVMRDKNAADIETALFGRLVRPDEKILVYAADVTANMVFKPEDMDKYLRAAMEEDGRNPSRYSIIAVLKPDDARIYQETRREAKTFRRRNIWKYEGFAMIMEEFVLDVLGMRDAKSRLVRSLHSGEHCYSNFYLRLKRIEGREGLEGVLKFLGFGEHEI